MPINQLWKGSNIQASGATVVSYNSVFNVKEGYKLADGTGVYVDLGYVYLDSVQHTAGHKNNTLQISASNETKKFDTNRFAYSHEFNTGDGIVDTFTGTAYSGSWQSDSQYWSMGGSQMIGTSTAIQSHILNTINTNLRNTLSEVTFQINAISGAHYGYLGSRGNGFYDGSSLQCYAIVADVGATQVYFQERIPPGASTTNIFNYTQTFTANTDYYLRLITYENRMGAFFSTTAGLSWIWLGNTWYVSDRLESGMALLGNQYGTIKYDNFSTTELTRVYDINRVLKDTVFKSGIHLQRIYIPDVYSTTFSDFSGLSTYGTGGTWTLSSSIATANGISNVADFNVLLTGASFTDFRFECEVKMGASALGGLVFGVGSSSLHFWGLHGLSSNVGVSLTVNGSLKNALNVKNSVTWNALQSFIPYPYNDQWVKLSVFKSDDSIRLCINDDTQVYAYIGASSVSRDSVNHVGVGMWSQGGGVSYTGQFRNLRVTSLSEVIDNFTLNVGSNASNAIDRLNGIHDFKYTMQGVTLTIIPTLSSTDGSSFVFNTGLSIPSYDIYQATNDTVISEVIVYGLDNIKATYSNSSNNVKRTRVIVDETLTTYQDCYTMALAIYNSFRQQTDTASFEMRANSQIEKYDIVTVIDSSLGVSTNFRVANTNKNYSAIDGSMTQTLTLEKP